MKKLLLFLLATSLISCATAKKIDDSNIKLRYLDDVVIPQNLEVEGTKVGGLSGIDLHNGNYYLVCDQPSNPRIYKAEIPLINRSIDTVLITEVIQLDKSDDFYKKHTPDLD